MTKKLAIALLALAITGCSSQSTQNAPTVDEKAEALERRIDGLNEDFERLDEKLDRLLEHLEDQNDQ